MIRTLIAGFGNVLRGDDGFGVEVIRQLAARGVAPGVELLDVGTGGIRLAQELLTPYDRLIIVDAMHGRGEPGDVYVVEVEDVEPCKEIDMHVAVPARALSVARALGALPPRVFIVGCEPVETEELSLTLSPPVARAVATAIDRIDGLLDAGVVRSVTA